MKKLFHILLLALLLPSCVKERLDKPLSSDGEREVSLELRTPSGTRAPGDETAQERDVKDLTLLVFDGGGDDGRFLYSRNAWRRSAGSDEFRTTMKVGSGLTIYYAANARGFIGALPQGVLEAGKTWAQIRESLVLASPAGLDVAQGLPMWSKAENVTIEDKPYNNLGVVRLLRSVASVDVGMALSAPSAFTWQKGHLVFAADRGYLPYDPAKVAVSGSDVTVAGPTSPPGMTTGVSQSHTLAPGATEICNVFYMYENTAALQPAAGANRQSKVIIEGVWNNPAGSGRTTYYPLSLRSKTTGDKLQVTRNTKYVIVVTGVNGDGFVSLDEAKEGEDVNIDYDVIPWGDNNDTDIIIDGAKYFSLPAREVVLGRREGSMRTLAFRTNFAMSDIRIRFGESGAGENPLLDSHPRFRVEMKEGLLGGVQTKYFEFTAKLPYGASDNPQEMIVTAGRLKFTVKVIQKDGDDSDWNKGPDTETNLEE